MTRGLGVEPSAIYISHMRLASLPRTYLAFVLVMLAGLPVMLMIQGERIHASAPALALVALLLYALGRGSMLAWALFLLWNLFTGSAVALSTGGGQMLLSGWLLLAMSVVSLKTMERGAHAAS